MLYLHKVHTEDHNQINRIVFVDPNSTNEIKLKPIKIILNFKKNVRKNLTWGFLSSWANVTENPMARMANT